MLKIRMARVGKRKRPSYRFVVSDGAKDTLGTYIEVVGYHDPINNQTDIKKDRVEYWVSKGAQMTPTVHNLFVDKNVVAGPKKRAFAIPKKEAAPAEATQQPATAPTETPAEAPAEAQPAPEQPAA